MPYYGFNFQWMYTWEPGRTPQSPDLKALDFLASQGFNFVRIPLDYRFWTKDFNYFQPHKAVFTFIDQYLDACWSRDLHISLNLHRAPGYCINGNNLERHNLWLDKIAQDAFVYNWQLFANRYNGIPSRVLSFDLLNEPPFEGDFGLTRKNHAAIIRRTVDAIRAIDPQREIVINGLGGGLLAIPELNDLGVTHSGRGYAPGAVSHYGATWWDKVAGIPQPIYPGTVWDGVIWDKSTLHDFYKPWRDVQASGTQVHIGECGCYNKTPNDVALRWLTDLFSLYKEYQWGFALWNFEGPFGIVEHGRPGAKYETLRGYNVDRELLELLLVNRVETVQI